MIPEIDRAAQQGKRLQLFLLCLFFSISFYKSIAQTINTGPVAGKIYACPGSPSASPYIQQFFVSGNGLSSALNIAAPSAFEVSLSQESGYQNAISLTPFTGTVPGTTVYVRASANASSGVISGNVTLSSAGVATTQVAVSGIINALPVLNPLSDQLLTKGERTQPVDFSIAEGTAVFNWTNSSPSIGLPASGTGNLASFIAKNDTKEDVTATISVTPVSVPFAYLPRGSNLLSVINLATGNEVTSIQVGANAVGVAVSSDGKRVYVANSDSDDVSVINTLTNKVIARVPAGDGPQGIAFSANKWYVTNRLSSTVSAFYAGNNGPAGTINVGDSPNGIAASPDGSRLYVTNGSDNVSVINTSTNAVVATVAIGATPMGIAVSPDGGKVYVANNGLFSNTVSVIDAATNTLAATIPVGPYPYGIAVSPDGARVYVTNNGDNTVSVIDTSIHAVIATIPVGAVPQGLSVSIDGLFVYVVNQFDGNVTVINTASNAVVGTLDNIGFVSMSLGNFVTGGTGCTGASATFEITVKPLRVPPSVTVTEPVGKIIACAGSPSDASGSINFLLSGSDLTSSVTATAPAGFEISFSRSGGYSGVLTLIPVDGKTGPTPIYARAAANNSAGTISGDILITSEDMERRVAIEGEIRSLPTVSTLTDLVYSNGAATAPIEITGTGTDFIWNNNIPVIGLASGGPDVRIPSFIATNSGDEPVVATISVTPISSGYAFIPSPGGLSVVSTTENKVVSSISINASPYGVAVSPDGKYVYVTDENSHNVQVISTRTKKVISAIPVESNPSGVALSNDGTRLYVNCWPNKLYVINTLNNRVITSLEVGNAPSGLAINDQGTKVYVANRYSNSVSVINAITNTLITSIPVGRDPSGVAVTPDGSKVFVSNYIDRSVSVIQASTNTVVKTLAFDGLTKQLAVHPDGTALYVCEGNNISVIGTATYEKITSVASAFPLGVSVSGDGQKIFAAGSNMITAIDANTNTVTATIDIAPNSVAQGRFISNGTGCVGSPISFTITVNPATLTATEATGRITTCQGSASASPNVQQFTVTGFKLTGDVLFEAPTGFEISTAQNSGYGGSLAQMPVNGEISVTIYVRASAAAPKGYIHGKVRVASANTTEVGISVSGVVYPAATVDPVDDIHITSGVMSSTVLLSADATSQFYWTNNNTSIGLAGSGTGNVPSFTAFNTDPIPAVSTITVNSVSVPIAYVSTLDGDYVWVINAANNIPVTKIRVGEKPQAVSVSPDGRHVYIAGSQSVSVISTASNTVLTTIPLAVPTVGNILVSSDGTRVYVAVTGAVTVINTVTMEVIATIPGISSPKALAISPDGTRLFVGNTNNHTVHVFDTGSLDLVTTFGVSHPFGIHLSPDGSKIYVASLFGKVTVVESYSYTTKAVVNVGSGTWGGLVVSPDGERVYVSCRDSQNITVINTKTNSVIGTIPLANGPYGISINQAGTKVYAVTANNYVYVINTATNTVAGTIITDSGGRSIGNFITQGNGCTSQSQFTVTVYKEGTQPELSVSASSGTISSCEGTESKEPELQQFTVSGSNIISQVTVNAPPNFEVSLSENSGFGSTLTLDAVGNVLNNTAIYVRSSMAAPAGTISGDVIVKSTGAIRRNVAVSGIVLPSPKLISSTLTEGKVGISYSTVITGAPAGYMFSATGLPSGLTMGGDGTISGTPLHSTTSPAAVTVTVSGQCPSSADYFLEIKKGTAEISVSNSTHSYDGTPRSVLVTTVPQGLSFTATYAGSHSPPVSPGIYPLAVQINSEDYEGSFSGSLVISKANATVALSALTKTYDGVATPITTTTDPPGLPVSVVYNGSSTVPKNPGTYDVLATVVSDLYTGSSPSVLVINKASAEVKVSAISYTYDGTSKSANVTTVPPDLPLIVTYNGASGFPINAGTYNVEVTVQSDFYSGSAVGTLDIAKAAATVKISNIDHIYSGTAKSGSITTVPPRLSNTVTYNGVTTSVTDAGQYNVMATVMSQNYSGSSLATMTIGKATLVATANDFTKRYGENNPSFTISYEGFVNGESASVIDQQPSVATSAEKMSDAGTYPIKLTGGLDNNYTFMLRQGTLVVDRASQVVTFTNIGDRSLNESPVILHAQASSGLPLVFKVTSGLAEIEGNVLTLKGAGEVQIQADQQGNMNFLPAFASQSFIVSVVTGSEFPESSTVDVFPNPASNVLKIHSGFRGVMSVTMIDSRGREVLTVKISANNEISIAHLAAGLYKVRLQYDGKETYKTIAIH